MIGDIPDILARLKSLIPNGWFGSTTPVLDSVLTGIATVDANIYALAQYAQLQTRIKTATGGWLDLIAMDFYGSSFPRGNAESDGSYRTRILASLFSKANTRAVITAALEDLTGSVPLIIEPWSVQDTGEWDGIGSQTITFWDVETPQNPSHWTSNFAATFYVQIAVPPLSLLSRAWLPAYDQQSYYDTYSADFIDISSAQMSMTSEVIALIERLKGCGVQAFVQFTGNPGRGGAYLWDIPGETWDDPSLMWDAS
jgi:hypothetical protein